MKLPRRRFLHLAAVASALPRLSRIARAQTYPSRPVHLIVPLAPAAEVYNELKFTMRSTVAIIGNQVTPLSGPQRRCPP